MAMPVLPAQESVKHFHSFVCPPKDNQFLRWELVEHRVRARQGRARSALRTLLTDKVLIANLPKGSHPPIGGSAPTQQAAAKIMNVSVRSGQRARLVKAHGDPGLIRAVEQGEVKVAAAAEFAKDVPLQDQAR